MCCRIEFTVVCEPPEDDDSADCFDIGVASISLADVIKTKKNIEDISIPSKLSVYLSFFIYTRNLTSTCMLPDN